MEMGSLVEAKMAGGKGGKGGTPLQKSAHWIRQRYQASDTARVGTGAVEAGWSETGGNWRKPAETP
jgi:hypothetical protein